MRRRDFIRATVGSAAAGWPVAARAQQPAMPVVVFLNAGSAEGFASAAAAFRNGLGDGGYVEGQNVTVDYHWLEGGYDRMPGLVADLVRHHVAVIVTPTTQAALAAKAATTTIPIVFGVAEDPASLTDMFRQVGIYTGRILKGEKPAELPVLQSTKFELVINLQTAKALGIEVPLKLQMTADEVIQ
jgi:ABC-type uncharacterized transport system substrate-binding protein